MVNKIPSMVTDTCRAAIRRYASMVHEGCIVEIGTFLGACTVEIFKGLNEAGKDNRVYCYDHFKCIYEKQQEIARGHAVLEIGKSYLQQFIKNTELTGGNITITDANIRLATWNRYDRIALYIDDAAKKKENFDHMTRTFFPSLIPGAIVMLLDYYYYEKKPKYCYQRKWMQKHEKNFEFVERPDRSSPAVFRYLGGL